jgi:hypothetical protein
MAQIQYLQAFNQLVAMQNRPVTAQQYYNQLAAQQNMQLAQLAALQNAGVMYDYGRSAKPAHVCDMTGCCTVSTPTDYDRTAVHVAPIQQRPYAAPEQPKRITCIEESLLFSKEKRRTGIPWRVTLGFWIPVIALIAGILVMK